jgi:hypothetical protein
MKNRRLISRILLFAVLLLCLSLSPIVSAQKTKPRRPTTERQGTNRPSQQACCSLGNWNLATHLGPGHRADSAMVYDSGRHRVVLFGGWVGGVRMGDTWEWDGNVWTQKANSGPSVRGEHAMAYDPSRGRVVLYGGSNFTGVLQDTWEWDGITWTLKATGGPGLRMRHAMAYDSVRGKVIMFGGMATQVTNSLFEWNGTGWAGIVVSGAIPSPRELHALANDSARGRVVLFGGQGAGGIALGDTWEWNGSNWTQKSVTGPSKRVFHSMAFSPSCGKVMLFGGLDASFTFLGDTWQWDGSVWTQVATTGPSPRGQAGMAYDSLKNQLVLFGGHGTGPSSDETWTMDTIPLSAEFQLSATSLSGNSTTYQLTATNAPLGNGVSFWWRVEEIDVVTGAVVSNTTMTNPSAWWANPTTNVFSGYYNNSSPIGVFYLGHKYRISHGVWNSCNPWTAVSKTVFMCLNCRQPEMKDVPSIKTKPKISMQ